LADHLANDQEALEYYQRFKLAIIAGLRGNWILTGPEIDEALGTIRAQATAHDQIELKGGRR
jgi:hypothetical protein